MKKFCTFFLIFFTSSTLAAMLLLTYAGVRGGYSVYENRLLASKPELTFTSLTSGEYFRAWEEYIRDNVWNRDLWLKTDTFIKMKTGREAVNDVMISDAALLPYVYGNSLVSVTDDAERMADSLAALNDAVTAYGGIFIYVGVPNQYSVYRGGYPSYMDYVGEEFDAVADAFYAALRERGIRYINVGAELTEDELESYYFKTDHHMNLRGSVYTCDRIFKTLRGEGYDIPDYLSGLTYKTLENLFFGSRGRKLYGLSPYEDTLEVFNSMADIAFTRTDNGETAEALLYTLPESSGEIVSYGIFMGGDIAETVISTERGELSNALIFGDSYTNGIETVFYTGFNETRSLDLRHYTDCGLLEYIERYRPQVVVCVRDDANYLNFTGNGNIG